MLTERKKKCRPVERFRRNSWEGLGVKHALPMPFPPTPPPLLLTKNISHSQILWEHPVPLSAECSVCITSLTLHEHPVGEVLSLFYSWENKRLRKFKHYTNSQSNERKCSVCNAKHSGGCEKVWAIDPFHQDPGIQIAKIKTNKKSKLMRQI